MMKKSRFSDPTRSSINATGFSQKDDVHPSVHATSTGYSNPSMYQYNFSNVPQPPIFNGQNFQSSREAFSSTSLSHHPPFFPPPPPPPPPPLLVGVPPPPPPPLQPPPPTIPLEVQLAMRNQNVLNNGIDSKESSGESKSENNRTKENESYHGDESCGEANGEPKLCWNFENSILDKVIIV